MGWPKRENANLIETGEPERSGGAARVDTFLMSRYRKVTERTGHMSFHRHHRHAHHHHVANVSADFSG